MGQSEQQHEVVAEVKNEVVIDGSIKNEMTVSFPLSQHGDERAVGKVICHSSSSGKCVIESDHSPGTFIRHFRQDGDQTIISY